jgi:hypothetical protein
MTDVTTREDAAPVAQMRSCSLDCCGCGGVIDPRQRTLCEFVLDGVAQVVALPARRWRTPPPGATLVDYFHAACYEQLARTYGGPVAV